MRIRENVLFSVSTWWEGQGTAWIGLGGSGSCRENRAVGRGQLGMLWEREAQAWLEASDAPGESPVSFQGPAGVWLERVGLEDDAFELPGMSAHQENFPQGKSILPKHTHVQAHKHIGTHVCRKPQANAPMHTGLCPCAHIWQCTHMHLRQCIDTDSVHLYTEMHTHAHTGTHIYTHTPIPLSVIRHMREAEAL